MDCADSLVRDARVPDLWFTDGSVVLEAGSRLFRVYFGILAQASSVFKDLLTIPQPLEEDCETYDGCPLVHMPDLYQDLYPFLKALHDCSAFDVNSLKQDDVPTIVSVLRLSTKYEVPVLRKRAIDALLRWYPSTLPEYLPMSGSARPLQEHPRHVLVANAARETDVLILLPAALLFCCATANARTLYDGLTREGVHYRLVEANRRAIFVGRPKLSHAARSRTQSFFFYPRDPDVKCLAPNRCSEFCRIYSSMFDEKDDPFMNPFHRMNWKAIRSTCCTSCATNWEAAHDKQSLLVWQELPSYFDLPLWPDLIQLSHLSDSLLDTSSTDVCFSV